METILNARSAKVYVIVGGSSSLYGVGQHRSLVWTKVLQALLGSDYRVINFAQRGGSPNDFGNLAVEMLIKSERHVILIADSNLAVFTVSLQVSPTRQATFDAWIRSELLPYEQRDRFLWNAALHNPKPPIRRDRRRPERSAQFQPASDVGYEYFGSICSSLLARPAQRYRAGCWMMKN